MFKGRVYGPILCEVTLDNVQHAAFLEQHCPSEPQQSQNSVKISTHCNPWECQLQIEHSVKWTIAVDS